VAERNKWSWYFETHGCLICETKKVGHAGLGMCINCKWRTKKRLLTLIQAHTPTTIPDLRPNFIDSLRKARTGQAPIDVTPKLLPAGKRHRKAG